MRILIVSEYFAPVRSVGAIRWTKIVKYLARRDDVRIDLLTNQKHFSSEDRPSTYFYDESAASETLSLDHTIVLPATICVRAVNFIFDSIHKLLGSHNSAPSQNRNAKASFPRKILQTLYERIYSFCLSNLLTLRANSIVRSVRKIDIDFSKYDAIISSSPPIWTHKLADKIKRENNSVLWIADYRDPSNNMSDIPQRLKTHIAQTFSQDADIVTTVWENKPDVIGIPDNARHIHIPNGYDPEEAFSRKRERQDIFRISYTGSLVLDLDLSPLFVALSNLIDRNQIHPGNIEVAYAGSTSNAFRNTARSYEHIVSTDYGFLTRKEALRLQDSSAMLAICTWNTKCYRTGLGGKLFELISSGIPVIGMCSGDLSDSPLKKLLSITNTGFCYEEAASKTDMKKLEEYILNCYAKWQEEGISKTFPNNEALEKYSHAYLADKIYGIIMEQIT